MDDITRANIVEALIFTSDEPVSKERMKRIFGDAPPTSADLDKSLAMIAERQCGGVQLQRVASGWRFAAIEAAIPYLSTQHEERPQKYSRAMLETLSLIAYKQPITRGEIEDVRGVAVSSHIIRTLSERGWIKVVGHKEVPGRPSLYATTPGFLDYFNLRSLTELPSLDELRDLEEIGRDVFSSAEITDDYTSVTQENADYALDEES